MKKVKEMGAAAREPLRPTREEAIEKLQIFGKGRKLNGLTLRELIEDGRRF